MKGYMDTGEYEEIFRRCADGRFMQVIKIQVIKIQVIKIYAGAKNDNVQGRKPALDIARYEALGFCQGT